MMTGIVSPTDPLIALKASYDTLLASKTELLAEKDKEIAHRDSQIDEKRRTIGFFVLIVALFVYDFLNPDRGWIRRVIERMQTGRI